MNSSGDQLQKLIAAANAGQLSPEQLTQLKAFLQQQQQLAQQNGQSNPGMTLNMPSTTSSSSASLSSNAPPLIAPGSNGVPQLQMPSLPINANAGNNMVRSPAPQQQFQPQPQQQQQQQQNAGSNAVGGNNAEARAVIHNLHQKIGNIEAILQRPDINETQRDRLQAELETTKRNAAQFINQVKAAAHAQAQANQMQQQTGVGGNMNDLQMAQSRAMAAKAQALQQQMNHQQAQLSQPQQQQQQQQQFQPQQQLQMPPSGLSFPPVDNNNPNTMGRSPNMQPRQIPPPQQQQQQHQIPPQMQQQQAMPQMQSLPPAPINALNNNNNAASPAISAASPPTDQQQAQLQNQKRGKQQQPNQQQLQQQAQQIQQQQQQQGGGRNTPQAVHAIQQQNQRPSSAASNMSNNVSEAGGNSSRFPITEKLSMPPYQAEAFPAARPTISSGLATNPIIGTPAITKPPIANLPSGRPGSAGGINNNATSSNSSSAPTPQASTSGGVGASTAPSLGQPGPLAIRNSEGRPYNKRKLQELVASIDSNQVLDAQVEDLLLEVADEFVDSITKFACRLAKHRRNDRLECKDLNLVLEKTYNMQIPGFGGDEVKQSTSNRRPNLPAYQARLAAVREAKAKK